MNTKIIMAAIAMIAIIGTTSAFDFRPDFNGNKISVIVPGIEGESRFAMYSPDSMTYSITSGQQIIMISLEKFAPKMDQIGNYKGFTLAEIKDMNTQTADMDLGNGYNFRIAVTNAPGVITTIIDNTKIIKS
jgi:hypothetical protein